VYFRAQLIADSTTSAARTMSRKENAIVLLSTLSGQDSVLKLRNIVAQQKLNIQSEVGMRTIMVRGNKAELQALEEVLKDVEVEGSRITIEWTTASLHQFEANRFPELAVTRQESGEN
jgi:hypothetical protein